VNRHLISAADLSRDDAVLILDTAAELASVADRPIKKLPTLRGRTVVNLFYEDSTRTRTSFEAAAKRLSADVINFSAKGSSVAKGESLKDTALTLEAMGSDAIVVRHPASGAPRRLADWTSGRVINAGDGTHEHPTQALLDAFTIRQRLVGPDQRGKGLDGVRVTIVGDVLHSRVARSNVLLLDTLGAEVTVVAPPTLMPWAIESWPCKASYDFDAELRKSDVVMMLRVQQERMSAAFFILACAAISVLALAAPRRPRLPQLCFLVLAAFLMTNKVWSPQYIVWLVPLAVLARPRLWPYLLWQLAEVGYYFGIWAYLIFQYRIDGHAVAGYQGISTGWYFALLVARFLTVALLAAYVVRDILHPERDVVRAHGLDDPAGGVLDQAPDWFRLRLAWPVSAGRG